MDILHVTLCLLGKYSFFSAYINLSLGIKLCACLIFHNFENIPWGIQPQKFRLEHAISKLGIVYQIARVVSRSKSPLESLKSEIGYPRDPHIRKQKADLNLNTENYFKYFMKKDYYMVKESARK